MSPHRAIQRRRSSILLLLPLLRRLALGRPSVDGSDFVLERRIDEAVPPKRSKALKLGGDDQRRKCLAAATCVIFCELGGICNMGWLGFGLPDMSVTSTWIAPRRCVMASRREASVIEAIERGRGDVRKLVYV